MSQFLDLVISRFVVHAEFSYFGCLILLHVIMCSWNLLISMPSGVNLDAPHSLKQTEEVVLDQVCNIMVVVKTS